MASLSSHRLPGIGEECSEGDSPGSERAGPAWQSKPNAQESGPINQDVPSDDIDIKDIVVDQMIGQGNFSEVFRASLFGEQIALKRVHTCNCYREIRLLRKVKHRNIVRMITATVSDGLLHIVMELCDGGSLFHVLHERRPGSEKISWPQRMRMCIDSANALEYLHGLQPQIIHRDLKSLNLLLVKPILSTQDLPLVKVADLGLSRTKEQKPFAAETSDQTSPSCERMTLQVGTLNWMAPEVHTSDSYNEKVDVYSFAMVLFEIAWQRIPYVSEDGRQTFALDKVSRGFRPDIARLPPGCPEELPALMKVCWHSDPARRPRFEKVHPWLQAVSAEKGYNQWIVAL